MSKMPMSTNNLYQCYSSIWPLSSLNMTSKRHIYRPNQKRYSSANNRITRFYIDDILADSTTSTTKDLCSHLAKTHKGLLFHRFLFFI